VSGKSRSQVGEGVTLTETSSEEIHSSGREGCAKRGEGRGGDRRYRSGESFGKRLGGYELLLPSGGGQEKGLG